VVTAEEDSDKLLGAAKIHWQWHADLWNIVTGKRKPRRELTAVMNRAGTSPFEYPFFPVNEMPSRGIWLHWINFRDGQPISAAAHMDGTHYREWPTNAFRSGFFLNDRYWIEQDKRDKPPMFYIIGLDDKSRDRQYLSSDPQVKILLDHGDSLRPPPLFADESDRGGSVEISTYRREDRDAVYQARKGSLSERPQPVQKRSIKLPSGMRFISARVSPQNDLLWYHLNRDYVNPWLTFLHFIRPTVSETYIPMESLWVSKADGSDFHEIGSVVVPPDKSQYEGVRHAIYDIKWLPGGKQISFAFQQRLYVVPANSANIR